MLAYLENQLLVQTSQCDSSGKLGVPDAFSLFMDLAGEHAQVLGVGIADFLRRGIYWLTVRTRVRFHRRPGLLEPVTAATWPEPPGNIRCNRCYELRHGDEILIQGKTEWAISEIATGTLVRPSSVFSPELTYVERPLLPEPFMRINADLSEAPIVSRHQVRASDIDVGQHMNNVAYVFALQNCFTTAEWNALPLKEVELAFRAPAKEGDELIWRRRDEGNYICLTAQRGEKPVILARLLLEGCLC